MLNATSQYLLDFVTFLSTVLYPPNQITCHFDGNPFKPYSMHAIECVQDMYIQVWHDISLLQGVML